ncbi:MAG TPA: hypothetical protein VIM65_07900 [Cyclobacteriaceae bacterium]
METQSTEEKTNVYSHTCLSQAEQHCFPTMTKEEIIEQYIEVKSNLRKAEKKVDYFYSKMLLVQEKYDYLKTKYPDLDGAEYNQRWCWVNKILFVLRKADRPLRSSDMIEFLLPLEPKLQWSYRRPQTFSAHLNRALRNKHVVACKRGGSHGYFYILPEWMDMQGRLLKKYEDKIVVA